MTEKRVGLFGLLGSGNIGNDGSLEAVLAYLKAEHPDAVLDALCGGPEHVSARYGIAAERLNWYRAEYRTASGVPGIVAKGLGKIVDVFRTAAWVRRHDVVIVPGMGVLEATLPLRPWGTPYALFLLCLWGKVFGTKVALVSVGSDVISQRATRFLVTRAARMAAYRSYRDNLSKDAMREMGVDVSGDEVYPDLAFALPVPPKAPEATGTVGVGVMSYRGGNDDRGQADEIYRAYLGKLIRFVGWLVAGGRRVRLFTGDDVDNEAVAEIISEVGPTHVSAAPVSSLDGLMREMSAVDSVVATRYHNVLCALKLSKPTLSIGYAAKNVVLMANMGQAEFCQAARSLDTDRLIAQFAALESRSEQVSSTLSERNIVMAQRIEQQFAALSAAVFSGGDR